MRVLCPACGGDDVRVSRRRGVFERVKSIFGLYPLRCRCCKYRFTYGLLEFRYWYYAKCPKCYSIELGTWSEEHYDVPVWVRLLLRLGASRHRCQRCRCNFIGFRPRKGRFSGRKGRESSWITKPNTMRQRNEPPCAPGHTYRSLHFSFVQGREWTRPIGWHESH